MEVAEKGALVGVGTGGDLRKELLYGNHKGMQKKKAEVLRKAMSNVEVGGALLLRVKDAERIEVLPISPVGVVEYKNLPPHNP